MQIFIMRHGEAQHFAATDAERELTANGKEKSQQMASWLADNLKGELDLVLVSPYVRAQQTWQCCQPFLPTAKKVLTEAQLTPYGDSEKVASYIKALIEVEKPSNILLVSHLPLVNYVASEFIDSSQSLSFSTSAICQINFDLAFGTAKRVTLQTP